ncbi:ABC transporter ATP-binding protein, partial [Vibrio lentus]
YFIDIFDKYNSQSNSSQADNLVLSTSPRYIMEWLAFVSLILIISVNLIIRDLEFSQVLPVLTVFGLATFKLLPSLQQAYNALTIIKGNVSVIDLLANDLMEANADEKSVFDEKSDIIFHDNIQISSASYSYPGKNSKALSNINLNISKNERIGIVGTSGAGKSTLIDVLTGLLELDSGNLNVDGVSVNKNRKSWSDNISYVPQVINLLDGTIAENIAFGCHKDDIDIDRINKVVDLANLNELVSSLPSGIDNDIGQNGVQLSGGQRQRLGIARALYTNANVLIFDEATSALDGITEDKIMKAIDNISGIKTIILIAHRLNTVKKCDTIYIMDKGVIVDSGDYESLVSKNEFFRELSKLS